MQVGIKVQVGKISKINKSAGWNKTMQVRINYGFSLKISKFNKSADWKISKI